MRQQLRDHDPVMGHVEAVGQHLTQLRDLRTHPCLGKLGQQLGLGDPRQQRFEHRACRLRVGLRGDAGQLDPRVLEHLLKALDRPRPLVALRLAKPREVTQPADLRRRHETRSHQPVRDQLADPLGILDVRLAAGDVAHVLRVQQPALKALLQRLKDGLPVHAGRLHPDEGDREPSQPLAKLRESGHRRAERLRRLHPATTVVARDPHRRHDVVAMHVQTRAPLDHHIHHNTSSSDRFRVVRRGPTEDESEVRARSSSQRHHRSPRHTFLRAQKAPSGAGVDPGDTQRPRFLPRRGGRARGQGHFF